MVDGREVKIKELKIKYIKKKKKIQNEGTDIMDLLLAFFFFAKKKEGRGRSFVTNPLGRDLIGAPPARECWIES